MKSYDYDRHGRILEVFDESQHEFLSNSAHRALEDHQGNVWLTTDSGIVLVPRSPVRLVVAPSEVDGTLRYRWRRRR